MEPVSNSGSCFAPLLTFRSAIAVNTTITATTMLSRAWWPDVSLGAATRFRILRTSQLGVVFVLRGNREILRCCGLTDY